MIPGDWTVSVIIPSCNRFDTMVDAVESIYVSTPCFGYFHAPRSKQAYRSKMVAPPH
jgi:hypothetical protein